LRRAAKPDTPKYEFLWEPDVDGSDALQPVAAPRARLRRTVSASDAFEQIARACAGDIRACQRGVGAGSSQAMHQARVALRRWRTALAVFGPLLSEQGRRLRGELAWLAGEMNEARDLDVLAPSLERRHGGEADATALEALATALTQARARAYQRAVRALRSERARRLLWQGSGAARGCIDAEGSGGGRPVRRIVAEALTSRRRRLARQGAKLDELDTGARHRLRIGAKKARYAAELFGELFAHPRRQRRFTAALKDLQDTLGELNDIHVGQGLARGLARDAGDVEAGFEAGLIAGERAGREAELLAKAGRAYERFAGVERFW
jgi:CHAD domain-containing protein